jgi:hypothetical protein
MRNVLILPNGSRQEFMYPSNRDIAVGEQFNIQMKNDSIQVASVYDIQTHDREIHYLLKV